MTDSERARALVEYAQEHCVDTSVQDEYEVYWEDIASLVVAALAAAREDSVDKARLDWVQKKAVQGDWIYFSTSQKRGMVTIDFSPESGTLRGAIDKEMAAENPDG